MEKTVLTSRILEKFNYLPLNYMFKYILEHRALEKCVFQEDDMQAVFLGHYLFFCKSSDEVFIHKVLNDLKHNNVEIVIVFYFSENSISSIFESFINVYQNVRSLYKLNKINNIELKNEVKEITKELLNSEINNKEMIIDEVTSTNTYKSMDQFCNDGIGFTYITNDEIKAFCTSEYPTKDSLAIGIEVDEEYQRKSIATDMTISFIKKAQKKNITNIYWECWKKNEPSVRTALKCGFQKVCDYPVLFIVLNK